MQIDNGIVIAYGLVLIELMNIIIFVISYFINFECQDICICLYVFVRNNKKEINLDISFYDEGNIYTKVLNVNYV